MTTRIFLGMTWQEVHLPKTAWPNAFIIANPLPVALDTHMLEPVETATSKTLLTPQHLQTKMIFTVVLFLALTTTLKVSNPHFL